MKTEIYERLQMDVTKFDEEDVLTTSGDKTLKLGDFEAAVGVGVGSGLPTGF